jgi:hypothetical protein
MAVQPRELFAPQQEIRPKLELAPPPRPFLSHPGGRGHGHPIAAFVLLVALVAGIGFPVLSTAVEGGPRMQAFAFRPPAAAAIDSLTGVVPLPRSAWPRSKEPLGGIVFVSCTRLWTAWPDGSHSRPLLQLPGVSSPTFSPDAKTIAFFVSGAEAQELWLASADGATLKRVGTVVEYADTTARATALTWNSRGEGLAFALVSATEDVTAGGSVIWSLDLSTGIFERHGTGLPTPFFLNGKLGWATAESQSDFAVPGRKRLSMSISSRNDDLAIFEEPDPFSYTYERNAVAIQENKEGQAGLYLRIHASGRDGRLVTPPSTHRLTERSRPVLANGPGLIVVDLIDFTGERDVGIFDTRKDQWTVLDYAWEPATSPAPAWHGPLEARRARDLVEGFVWYAGKSQLIGELESIRSKFRRPEWVVRNPERDGESWIFPVHAYGREAGSKKLRLDRLLIAVKARDGRLVAIPDRISTPSYINDVKDVVSALGEMLGAEVVEPTLPPGTQLNKQSPLYAWSSPGYEQGFINFTTHTSDSGGGGGPGESSGGYLTIAYGSVYFQGSCGGGLRPWKEQVGDSPALFDKVGSYRQVIWPATPGHEDTARFSVYGELSKEEILAIAESMEAQR